MQILVVWRVKKKFLGCQSHILNEIKSIWIRTSIIGVCYTIFFHIFTESFALFSQNNFCSGGKFPLMGISMDAIIMDSRLTNSLR